MALIYLDHNAATPLDPRVLEAMLPYLKGKWGNASSRDHAYGWDASEAVEEARLRVAELIGAGHHEIVFTSGATESILIALHGLFPSFPPAGAPEPARKAGILASAVEHEAVLAPCRGLRARGVPVTVFPVRETGALDLLAFEAAVASARPALVCLMAANNETGVLSPLREGAAIAHAHGARFFTDAAQALGKIPLDARADGFDMAAFSAHKLCGPKGAGALYVRGGREALALEPLFSGGGQEGGLRGGTLNVPAIVGFGEACRLAGAEMAEETSRLRGLRDRLEAALLARIPGLRVNGDRGNRLANTSNLRFPGADARALIRDMHEVAVSTRSACSSGSGGPSHVLTAMGLSDEEAFASIRFSLGRTTTEADVDAAAEKVAASYARLPGRDPAG
ncbi:MAG TPA: cysteine desulfurase family protein [Fibrobacteria bacterium]|nr:cysteine desulfurase family protein [Fibrobacteria bacterium]